jgi:hypothetical protein
MAASIKKPAPSKYCRDAACRFVGGDVQKLRRYEVEFVQTRSGGPDRITG